MEALTFFVNTRLPASNTYKKNAPEVTLIGTSQNCFLLPFQSDFSQISTKCITQNCSATSSISPNWRLCDWTPSYPITVLEKGFLIWLLLTLISTRGITISPLPTLMYRFALIPVKSPRCLSFSAGQWDGKQSVRNPLGVSLSEKFIMQAFPRTYPEYIPTVFLFMVGDKSGCNAGNRFNTRCYCDSTPCDVRLSGLFVFRCRWLWSGVGYGGRSVWSLYLLVWVRVVSCYQEYSGRLIE